MQQENTLSQIAKSASVFNLFNHHRTDPELPPGFHWPEQKALYCPKGLRERRLPIHKFGYVFCHRGLYERASGIIDNSVAAIDNGIHNGLFLHEVDALVPEQLGAAFIAHDKHPSRVTSKSKGWEFYSILDILSSNLVIRRAQRKPKDKGLSNKQDKEPTCKQDTDPAGQQSAGVSTERISDSTAFLETEGQVPGLFDILWRECKDYFWKQTNGITLQVDLREEDLAKAMAYYSYHVSKKSLLIKERQGVHRSRTWKLFQSTILKGYNKHYKTFEKLQERIREKSEEAYGSNYFEIRHLDIFPPLIMVFYANELVNLAEEHKKSNKHGDTYEYIYQIFKAQVESFVGVGPTSYNFILEIVHSGLGLGYNRETKIATNPLNGSPLTNGRVIIESLVDRVMIDLSLELRNDHPQLLFSSCTRLPDVITPEGKHKASFKTSRLMPWETGERGLVGELRAIHGGLYPQCQFVVADDPASEIAARTWIDQYSDLDRSDLLRMSYTEWLAGADADVQSAITKLNNQDFMPNVQDSTVSSSSTDTEPEWLATVGSRMNSLESSGKKTVSSGRLEFPPSVLDSGQQNHDLSSLSERDCNTLTRAYHNDSVNSEVDRSRDEIISTWETRHSGHFRSSIPPPVVPIRIQNSRYHVENLVDMNRAIASIAMYEAAKEGDLQMVEYLLTSTSGVNINKRIGDLGTPLMAACVCGHVAVAKCLLAAGANAAIGSPLECAASSENPGIVKMLLAALTSKNVNYQRSRKSSIEIACEKRSVEIVEMLLEADAAASISVMTDFYRPLETIARSGDREIAKLLLSAHKRSQAKYDANDNSTTLCVGEALHRAVHRAIYQKDETMVKLLLDNRADIDFRAGSYNSTALQIASRVDWEGSLINLLLKGGATVDVPKEIEGRSALRQAVESCDLYVTNLLLERGDEIDFTLPHDMDWKMLSLLKRYNYNPPPKLIDLRWACERNNLALAYRFLERGDPVDFPLTLGMGPEMISLLKRYDPTLVPPVNYEAEEANCWIEYARETERRKNTPRDTEDWVWIESTKLRDCGCVVCLLEKQEQVASGSHPLYSKSPENIPTISDPVSVTLVEIGKLDSLPLPEQMKVKFYTGPTPKSCVELEEVQFTQISSQELIERHRKIMPDEFPMWLDTREWDDINSQSVYSLLQSLPKDH